MEKSTGPRRAPRPEERQLDAERSRARLLEAALEEFAAKGFAGARVQDIADRAGLNKQMINYYFGGKAGIYGELQRQWLLEEEQLAAEGLTLEELIGRYLHDSLTDPRGVRLMIWDGLHDRAETPPVETREADELADLRRRQATGELAADLDPGGVLLMLMGAVIAPIVMPHLARKILGADPAEPAFEERYGELLRRVVQRLATPETTPTKGNGP